MTPSRAHHHFRQARLPLVVLLFLTLPLAAQEMTFEETMTRGKTIYKEAEEMRWNGSDESPLPRFREAARLFEVASTLDPSSQEALYFLGYAYDRIAQVSLSGDGYPSSSLAEAKEISEPFERLIALDRRYEGEILLLTPRSKITSVWGSLAAAYAMRGLRDSATWAFREGKRRGGFLEPNLSYCRNILASCDRNAILFVGGDADTYPTWYEQLVEGFRRDVIVVNLSLLNAPWFVRSMRDGNPFGEGALPVGYVDAELAELRVKVIDAPEKIDVLAGEQRAKTRLSISGVQSGSHQLLRVQEQVVMNVLRMNNGRRPIYVSHTIADVEMEVLGMLPYLEFRGFARRFVPRRALSQLAKRSLSELTMLMMNDRTGFDWRGLRDSSVWTDDNAHTFMVASLDVFLYVGGLHLVGGNRAGLAELLARMEQVIPLNALHSDELDAVEPRAHELYEFAGRPFTLFKATSPH